MKTGCPIVMVVCPETPPWLKTDARIDVPSKLSFCLLMRLPCWIVAEDSVGLTVLLGGRATGAAGTTGTAGLTGAEVVVGKILAGTAGWSVTIGRGFAGEKVTGLGVIGLGVTAKLAFSAPNILMHVGEMV